MHKLLLAYLLAPVIVGCSAHAAANPEAGDAFYDQGVQALQHMQRLTAEQSGDADELTRHLNNLDANMARAAQLGHPAAALFEAHKLLKQRSKDPAVTLENRRQGCASLDAMARTGFVAAAVLNTQECDTGYKRFEYSSLEHRAVMEALEQSLKRRDPGIAYYPLPIRASQCFAAAPTQMNELTHGQFRAEAEYILGSSQPPQSREAVERNLRWLDAAFQHGCLASLDMRPMLRKQLASYSD
ncbi:hypothetical protein D16iCDA_19640 [Pseudomonas seleniipraecipitans]|uniref:Lipoprotein n=1 Tax=Phytopseudomonas seleniipraecipitans TaxID=640205 RepID=A0ABY5J720_9GAMM|nr:hypothetical protein [Pseudomonas seleniipraecipitans]UUD63858.1 hypothetical protein D16iCDA_19640 [Pseudomonas seleniipraecipitans]